MRPAPRLHLQTAVTVFGLSTAGAALVAQPVPTISGPAVVTRLTTPGAALSAPPTAAPELPVTVSGGSVGPVTIVPPPPAASPRVPAPPVLGDGGRTSAAIPLGGLVEIRLAGGPATSWSVPRQSDPAVLQPVASAAVWGGLDVVYRAARRGDDMVTVMGGDVCPGSGGAPQEACGAVAMRLTVAVV